MVSDPLIYLASLLEVGFYLDFVGSMTIFFRRVIIIDILKLKAVGFNKILVLIYEG